VTQDRRHLEDAAGRGGQEVDPPQQHVAHRWGHVVDVGPGAADLADEERVAAGPVRDRGGHCGVDGRVGGPEQLGDLVSGKARERDTGAGARQFAEQTVQRVLRRDIGVAVGPHDREVRGTRSAGDGPQQLE
jgi:hypothetical protein